MAVRFTASLNKEFIDLTKKWQKVSGTAYYKVFQSGFAEITKDFRREMGVAYANQGTPRYKWPPNEPRYALSKGNQPPGVRTGAVRQNLVTGKGRGAMARATSTTLRLGTTLRHANFGAVGRRDPTYGVKINQRTHVYRKRRLGRNIVGRVQKRKIPVRDPLLQVYNQSHRKLRLPVARRWRGYLAAPLYRAMLSPRKGSFSIETDFRSRRARERAS